MAKKTIIIGVTGGIAAYKTANLVSSLSQKGYDVHVMMTENATEFVTPLTFEVLSNNPVAVHTFDRNMDYNVNHIGLAKKADLFLIAPATANIIGKLANGIADDMLSTQYLAMTCPVLIAPAMNTSMLNHISTQRNIAQLKADGVHFVTSGAGFLACGDIGAGRLADLDVIEVEIERLLQGVSSEKLLQGKKVVITAGPTVEAIDPVRFISNHSSGKMGYALAEVAHEMGADVTLITGPTALARPVGIEVVSITSAQQMYEASMAQDNFDFFIGAAAVSDYRVTQKNPQKIKKKDQAGAPTIELVENPDIVASAAKVKKSHQTICAFAMETENLVDEAKRKLEMKQVDLVVANNLLDDGAGFAGDTNKVTFVTKSEILDLPLMDKVEVANQILLKLQEISNHARND